MPPPRMNSCGSRNATASRWALPPYGPPIISLHHLFVDPDWQGKHIGSALLAQVERSFTASGTLKCLMENKNALRFYQRHGWTIEAQGASPEGRYWLMRSPRP